MKWLLRMALKKLVLWHGGWMQDSDTVEVNWDGLDTVVLILPEQEEGTYLVVPVSR